MVGEILLTMAIITSGWYIAWNWKIKHMTFVRKLFDLDVKNVN